MTGEGETVLQLMDAAWAETVPTRRAGEKLDGVAQLQRGGGSPAGLRAGGEETMRAEGSMPWWRPPWDGGAEGDRGSWREGDWGWRLNMCVVWRRG